MKYSEVMNDTAIYQPNARAEDGMDQPSQWNGLCEYVLIPAITLFAIFLTMLGMMLLNY